MAQSLRLKVLTLITKLSDRDTYTLAATELETLATSLDATSLPTFLSCILSTDSNDKSLVRRHCLHLLSTLSLLHAKLVSAHLPKILSYVVRRLRDGDSAVRSECVAAVASLAGNVTRPPFSTAFLKPLSEAVFTEQEAGAQVGSALCLAAAIDAAADPEAGRLGRAVVGRVERLLKSEGYKGKSAGLVLLGSVIAVGAVRGYAGMGGLVKCLVGFLSSKDWAARKAAAEALRKLALVEADSMPQFKTSCLQAFENRRFDKVKAAREAMNQMIEAWKQVPDVSEEVSPPPRSVASSREDAGDERYTPESKNSRVAGAETPQTSKKAILGSRRTPDSSLATTARKRSPLKGVEKKTGPAIFRKVDCKKPLNWDVEMPIPNGSTSTGICSNDLKDRDVKVPERRVSKPETRRALFGKISDDKMHKFGGLKSGSRVAPYQGEGHESTVAVSDVNENHNNNHKECENLSSIRNQLVQIERQQTSLLDLLQRFIGSSQNGMHVLETRVHGLELALDEISYDLAVSSGRMSNSHRSACCLLPGAGFFSSRFWKKTEACRLDTSKFSSSIGTRFLTGLRHRADKNGNAESFSLEARRLQLQGGGGGLIVNPLAEIHSDSRGITEVAQYH